MAKYPSKKRNKREEKKTHRLTSLAFLHSTTTTTVESRRYKSAYPLYAYKRHIVPTLHLSESGADPGDGGDGVSPRAQVCDAPKELEGVALLLEGVLGGALAHDVHLLGKTKKNIVKSGI